MRKIRIFALGVCICLLCGILFVPNVSADSTAKLTIMIRRIQKLDPIEDLPLQGEADWYYYVGVSEDGGNTYTWQSSSIPARNDDDDWIVNKYYYFSGLTTTAVTIAITLCEDDVFPDGGDDLADISSGVCLGSCEWNDKGDPILPSNTSVFSSFTYEGNYDLKTNTLTGDQTTEELGYHKTSGEYDGSMADQNDAAVYFAVWDNYNAPTSVMHIYDTHVKAGELVNFDGSGSTASTGSEIDRYQWDFNNDGVWDAEGETTSFTYMNSGTHTVKLKITDSLGETDTATGYVTVYPDPNASFVYSPSSPSTLDTIQFTDTSTITGGTLASWHWSFGDYSTSTLRNPTHKYSQWGTYTVKLTVTADDGQTTDFETKYISVIELATITGTVEDPDDNPISGATVKLYDTGTTTVLETATTDANGEYTISEVETGEYDIEASKSDYDNNKKTGEYIDAGGKPINFVLTPENQPPKAEFHCSPDNPKARDIISFTDSSSDNDGTIESCSWDFGDGTSSNKQNTTHTYSFAGEYTVTLTVTDNGGKTDIYNSKITVEKNDIPGFELVLALLAIAIVCILLSKKKLKHE